MTKSQGLVVQFDSHKKKKLKLNVEEITFVQDERKEEMNGKKKKKKRKADDKVCEDTENISEENIQVIQSTETNTYEQNAEMRKHKKKKSKVEGLETSTQLNGDHEKNIRKKKKKSEVCVPVENITEEPLDTEPMEETHKQEGVIKEKKKKRRNKDSEAVVPESDPVTPQEEANTHTAEEKKQKKRKKSSAEVCVPVENITEEPMEEKHKQEDHMKKKKKRKHKQDSEAVVPESDPVTPQEEANTHTAEEKKQKKRKKSSAESSGDVNTSVQQQPSGVEDENGLDGDEELSPEERRVLERKLKKILNKEEKRKLKEEGKSIKPEKSKTNVAEKQALEYLACWSKKREAWKFNKSRQTWLLQHMYDSVKVSDDHFEMLLLYIDGLQGLARSSTLQQAEAIVRWEGQGEEADKADAEKKQRRAKQIVQML
ncbi:protein cholesin isoform X2 [Siphateles boraxobius]|uniref:protein cholesin isoform X2 n=1 Tax=Siphateles boraxobius TaxID=180520 RepID=UPI0040646BDC